MNLQRMKQLAGIKITEDMDPADTGSSVHPVNMIKSVIHQLHPGPTGPEDVAKELPPLAREPEFMDWYKQALDSFYGLNQPSMDDESEDDYTDRSMRRGEMGLEEARPGRMDPEKVNAMVGLPLEAARAQAMDMLNASTTNEDKKAYLARQIAQSKNTMAIIKLLYDMILKGEGQGVQGSTYAKKFGENTEVMEQPGGITINGRDVDMSSIEIDGVDPRDYPDFVDAYVSHAVYTDGTPLSDADLNQLMYDYSDMVHELAHDSLHENLQNGYDTAKIASGDDYFPNGADGPVTSVAGPSGARQGDNPEQKKMQVAEVHKELVYGYRKFLKESAPAKSTKRLNENQQMVSNVEVQGYQGDFDAGSDSTEFEGTVSFSASVAGASISYDLDISASSEFDWESDESPTGWNYSTDDATYGSYEYAVTGPTEFSYIQFADGSPLMINDRQMSLEEAQQIIDPTVLQQLLQPQLFVSWFDSMFEKHAEDLTPSSPDDGY